MSMIRDRMRAAAPRALRDQLRRGLVRYGELTADYRPPPDFLIIGTKRGGTTSLWHYLVQHPLVFRLFPAWNGKSPHYFEENWYRGHRWYRSHFPTARARAWRERRHRGPSRCGEASPLYMFHPLVAQRVRETLPGVKLLVLLRDPVERAYSHWKERRTQGTEPLDFAAALAAEPERTAGEREAMLADPGYFSQAWDWYTYRARGRYLEHLEPWLDRFDPSQLLILSSERLYRDPHSVYATVLDFLDLPPWRGVRFDVHNDRPSAPMDPAIRAELAGYYRPHNQDLQRRLGMAFDWDGQ
jgi:hypothetical protein